MKEGIASRLDVVDRRAGAVGRQLRIVACAAIVLGATVVGGSTSVAAPPTDTSGTAKGVEMTARWWQVAMTNFDTFFFGDYCVTVDLPAGPIVLVAGTFGGPSGPRACTVPAGATLVLPVINQIFVLSDPVPDDRVGEARFENREFVADVTTATASIDGVVSNAIRRIRSPRFLVDGAPFGVSGPLSATSDGYWLVVRLSEGVHSVSTLGETSTFSTSTTYTITVS